MGELGRDAPATDHYESSANLADFPTPRAGPGRWRLGGAYFVVFILQPFLFW